MCSRLFLNTSAPRAESPITIIPVSVRSSMLLPRPCRTRCLAAASGPAAPGAVAGVGSLQGQSSDMDRVLGATDYTVQRSSRSPGGPYAPDRAEHQTAASTPIDGSHAEVASSIIMLSPLGNPRRRVSDGSWETGHLRRACSKPWAQQDVGPVQRQRLHANLTVRRLPSRAREQVWAAQRINFNLPGSR